MRSKKGSSVFIILVVCMVFFTFTAQHILVIQRNNKIFLQQQKIYGLLYAAEAGAEIAKDFIDKNKISQNYFQNINFEGYSISIKITPEKERYKIVSSSTKNKKTTTVNMYYLK